VEVLGVQSVVVADDAPLDHVLPLGPMCPFRSSQMETRNIDQELASVVSAASRESSEFAQLAAQFGAGISPDTRKAREVGQEIAQQGSRLKAILDEMEQSNDFQAIETYHTLEMTAKRMNMPTFRTVEQLVNWQAGGLLAFADGRPLAPMPPGVDPAAIAAVAPGDAGSAPRERMFAELAMARSLPFEAEDFDDLPGGGSSEVQFLKADFQRLVKEHKQLVGLGETYGGFDTAGKEYYLNQMALIECRWEDVIRAARGVGLSPSEQFLATSKAYLNRAGFTATGFRELVAEVHGILRQQVAREAVTGR